MRRFGASRTVALVPAAVVALSGDNVFLEHALLTETLWGFSIALGLYALARAHDQGSVGWLAGAGALLACSAFVRNTSLALPPLAGVWAAVALGGPARWRLCAMSVLCSCRPWLCWARTWRSRTPSASTTAWSSAAATSSTCAWRRSPTAPASGLPQRRRGCARRPRPTSAGDPSTTAGSTTRRLSARSTGPGRPRRRSGAFARRAILHQPLDYARAVLKDEVRYFAPHTGVDRPDSGATPEEMSFGHTDPVAQPGPREVVAANYRRVYSGVGRPKAPGAAFAALSAYQEVFRVGGLVLAAVAALIAAGLALGRGRRRAVVALLAAFALAMYGLAPLTLTYDARYGVTPAPLAAAAAALAVGALLERLRSPDGDRELADGR